MQIYKGYAEVGLCCQSLVGYSIASQNADDVLIAPATKKAYMRLKPPSDTL